MAEVEDVLRTVPPMDTIKHPLEQNHAWFGRAGAIVDMWNPIQGGVFRAHLDRFYSAGIPKEYYPAFNQLMIVLYQAWNDLRMKQVGRFRWRSGKGWFTTITMDCGR